MSYTELVQNWQNNPQDYIVVYDTLKVADEDMIVYHIFDATHQISHIIEKQALVRELAQEMLDAGVRLVSMEEAQRILHPNQNGAA